MKNKKILISVLILSILLMSIGYASFATDLKIEGTTKINGEWEIKITDIKATSICNNCDAGEPTYDDTLANFNATLIKPGDSITYEITIANLGTIDAKLDDFTVESENEGSPAIIYTTNQPSEILNAGDTTTLTITTTYDKNTALIPPIKSKNFTSNIKYIQNND